MAKRRLTDAGVRSLATKKRQEDFWDSLTPGLCLRVSGSTGRKTWLVRYRANGKHRRHKLGTYPHMSLAEARDEARDVQSDADAGKDPALARQAEQETGGTFEAMAREVLEARARKGKGGKPTRKSTQRERERILERELLPEWGQRDPSTITRREVVLLVEGIAKRGSPVMANRTLALIRLLFNDALRRGFPGLEASPAHMVEPPGAEGSRDRYLDADEIKVVWGATEPENPLTRAAYRLALLTGQRIGSVLRIRWDGIDQNGTGALWTIPAEHFKGRRKHLVPLSDEALAIIDELREIAHNDEWAFPSRAGSKRPHMTNLAGALARIRDRSGLDHWTAHDFRTTFRTHATRAKADGGLGVASNVADAVLGHAENTLGWNRYQGDRPRYLLHEKREALTAWGAFVGKAVGA